MDAPERPRSVRRRLTRLELVGLAVGAATGLVAAAPVMWLAAEAHRLGNFGLLPAAILSPVQLLTLWALSATLGGILAAGMTRGFLALTEPAHLHWAQHLLHLAVGGLVIAVVAPLPAALLLSLPSSGGPSLLAIYLAGGGSIGWQSGVVAFVFLYTFRMAEAVRNAKEHTA